MAKFKAPDNFGGLTVGDQQYCADKKGFVTLPDDFPTDLAESHGLMSADAVQAAKDTPDVPDAPATIQPTGS